MKRFEQSISFAGLFNGENKKPSLILLLTPVILTTYKYYGTKPFYLSQLSQTFILFNNVELTAALYTFFSTFVLLGVIPALIVKFVFKERLASYGVQFGDVKFGLKTFLILAPIMVLSTYPSAHMPQFLAEYPLYKGAGSSAATFLNHAFAYLFFYLGWEFFFRGFMQFGLREKLGDWNAILVQTALSCLLHIGKPDGEIYSSILGALVWGVIAFRSRSLLFVLLMHWLLGVSLDFFICFVK
ncbi:MAG: CPBP family intramembrane metalloprotease [Ignavibacteriales bacterium]|nr:CPBP family intramembrane metalloprotease [Ignavibacteriales bacterium]